MADGMKICAAHRAMHRVVHCVRYIAWYIDTVKFAIIGPTGGPGNNP